MITAELAGLHPANARCPIRAAIRRREPRLGMRRPRRRRQCLPHRRPVSSRPSDQEPFGGGAAGPITARDRTPYEHATHNRRHDHQHAEHPHTAMRPRAAADRPPRSSVAPPSAGPATSQQHGARPRPRHHITRTTTTDHETVSLKSLMIAAFAAHLNDQRQPTARASNQPCRSTSPDRVLHPGTTERKGEPEVGRRDAVRGRQQRRPAPRSLLLDSPSAAHLLPGTSYGSLNGQRDRTSPGAIVPPRLSPGG